MNGIINAQAKLDWSQEHLKLLDREIGKFSNSSPYSFTSKEDTEKRSYVLRFKLADVPTHICMIVGDAVYNMRSALDQLVWGLVSLKGAPGRVAFPVIDAPNLTADSKRYFAKNVVGVAPAAVSEIDALQPYHRGKAYKSHPLWRLNEMCNLDKHRRIPANGSESVVNFPKLSDADRANGEVIFEALEEGFVITAPIALKHKLEVNPTMGFRVNFGGDTSGISEDFKGLVEMHKFIADDVLPRFQQFFT